MQWFDLNDNTKNFCRKWQFLDLDDNVRQQRGEEQPIVPDFTKHGEKRPEKLLERQQGGSV